MARKKTKAKPREWDAKDAEKVAPRDLLHDPTYLRHLLRETWGLLPDDVTDVFEGTDEDEVRELAARVAAILEEEVTRGYFEPEDGPEDDDEEDEDGDPDSDSDDELEDEEDD